MKLAADVNVDRQIVQRLRLDGHDLFSMYESAPHEVDEVILDTAYRDQRVLLTADTDFGELVVRRGLLTSGVVLIRLSGLSSEHKAQIVSAALHEHADQIPGSFTVIAPGSIRIRPIGS